MFIGERFICNHDDRKNKIYILWKIEKNSYEL